MTLGPTPLIAAIGDLIEDLVVALAGPIRHGTDTEAAVVRRRGGSAANVAAAAVVAGAKGRFIGNVGADDVGARLIVQLEACGVDVRVSRGGRTGTVVALIDHDGERSLLTDRGASAELASLPGSWLHAADAVHVPAYAFLAEPLATVAMATIVEANARGVITSIDASAVPVVTALGAAAFRDLVARLRPTVLICNADEGAALGVDGRVDGSTMTIVKNGPLPTVLHGGGPMPTRIDVSAVERVVDTTGAGDAFAAAFLVAMAAGQSPDESIVAGHSLAARSLAVAGALQGEGSDARQQNEPLVGES